MKRCKFRSGHKDLSCLQDKVREASLPVNVNASEKSAKTYICGGGVPLFIHCLFPED